jgi:hypothetical protein
MVGASKIRGWLAALIAAVALLAPGHASAAVEITFYAREMGSQFPHGFVVLAGTLDRTGERIDVNYGFTATHVSPTILFGSVRGEVEPLEPGYVRGSEPHFRMTLSDAEYDQVVATVTRYGELRQPSYNLNRRNCVHFIADVATALGMQAELPRNLTRRPRSFTELLIRSNREWLDRRGATILREPPPERPARRSERQRD